VETSTKRVLIWLRHRFAKCPYPWHL